MAKEGLLREQLWGQVQGCALEWERPRGAGPAKDRGKEQANGHARTRKPRRRIRLPCSPNCSPESQKDSWAGEGPTVQCVVWMR